MPLADADPAPAPGVGSTYEIPDGNLFAPGTAGARPDFPSVAHLPEPVGNQVLRIRWDKEGAP